MKKNTLILLLIILSFGCDNPIPLPNGHGSDELRDQKVVIVPLTKKERDFKKELNKRSFSNVEITVPASDMELVNMYTVTLTSKLKSTPENRKKLDSISGDIANELYKDIIADSILYRTSSIDFVFTLKNPLFEMEFTSRHPIPTLASINGFRVEKIGDHTYKRISTR